MPDYVAEQIAALKDEDWAIREEAATALGSFRDARAVLPLVSILRDSDRAVREAAIGALTAIGEPSVPVLGACLSDPELAVQEAASSILTTIADNRVIDPLVKALQSQDWIVRMHAAKALGRIGDAKAVDPLLPLLHDKVKAVRVETAAAFGFLGAVAVPSLVDALKHSDWLVRLHAVEALGKIKSSEAVEPLLFVLFNDRDTAVREDAARALGDIGDARAIDFLLHVMKEPGLRPIAIEALGRIGDRRAVPALVEVAGGSAMPDQTRAIDGCGDRWNEEMIAMGAAVRALGQIKDEAALPTLVAALQNTVTRAEAGAALGRFGPGAISFLLPLLAKEQDDNIRYHIRETLTQLGWRPGRI
ncbi:MAG: HEAT repeat domain-containing protein [Nitrospiraceae bacterium]